jgi:shikimate kinase
MTQIFLIGYRGSGKSTVGRRLAERLNRPFVDTDDEIERTSKQTIAHIFATEGEAGFRDREQHVVFETAKRSKPSIIALGGGAVLRPVNRQLLQGTGKCIWLQASPQSHFARIRGDADSDSRRPNLTAGGGYEEVVGLLAEREPIYRDLADFIVLTDDLSPDEIVVKITDWAKKSC